MQTHPLIKTSRPAPCPRHWGETIFANGGKDVLFNRGSSTSDYDPSFLIVGNSEGSINGNSNNSITTSRGVRDDCGDSGEIESSDDSEGDTSTNIDDGDRNAAGSINGDSNNSIIIGRGVRGSSTSDFDPSLLI